MIAQAKKEHVAIKGRSVFFANKEQHVRIPLRNRMLSPARLEVHPVENAVVLVGDQFVDDVLSFCA